MTTLEDFKKAIDLWESMDNTTDKLYDLGFDIINSKIFEYFHRMASIYFKSHFNEDGVEWIEWWMYEYSKEDKENKVIAAWDGDKNPIDLSTAEKLYEFLQDYLIEN